MNRFRALFLISLFIVGILAVGVPVQATFTLGHLTGTSPYEINNFDPHVPGVIGYVWPGAGQCAWDGFPNTASDNCSPGYQSPYPSGNPPGAPSNSWYQLQGDTYAPFGAVLTGSTGDLIFALNATACADWGATPTSIGTNTCNTINAKLLPGQKAFTGVRYSGRWEGVDILIPPGFAVPSQVQVVSTITNDYSGILVSRISPNDRYAPGWTLVRVLVDAGTDSGSPASARYYDHQGIDFTAAGEWYYVRINGVLAPADAGRYFFKILLEGGSPSICGEEGTGTGGGGLPSVPAAVPVPSMCSQFIPTENWPVMLVKGEVDPAIMTGTIRYAGFNSTLYGQPIQEAGKVWAKMTMRLDPYTGQQRPDLPTIDAIGYFNATATGHYEVEGLAPGVYDLYASAAGFPQILCESGITVLKGQSLHFDCYLQPGPVIHGNLFSKHQFGDEPWPLGDTGVPGCTNGIRGIIGSCTSSDVNGEYAKVELYDGPTLSNIPDPTAKLVSWSPLPCVAGGQEFYTGFYTAGACNDPRLGSKIGFPWHEYTPSNGYGVPNPASPTSYYQVAAGGAAGSGEYFNNLMQDPQGVGPPQHWFVSGGTTSTFHFEFGVRGEYGAPRDLDGMVPQVYATWVNGLTAGRYYVRAWVFRYVQSALDGATFQEYYFDVTPNEWAGDVTLPIDLRLSSWINKTVYFHDTATGTITTSPIDTGAGAMSGVLADANGNIWSYNQTLLGYEGSYTRGERSGWGAGAFICPAGGPAPPGTGCSPTGTVLTRNDLDKAKLNEHAVESGRANMQFWGWNDTWGGENYGIPSGTYTPHVYVLGYIEHGPPEQVSVTLSGTPTYVSDHLYRGVGLNITVYSIDWQRPQVARNWIWGNPVGYTDTGCGGRPKSGFGCTSTSPITGMPTSKGDTPNFPGDPRYIGPPGVVCTFTTTGCVYMVGEEIDIGLYANGTLIDFIGDEPSDLQDTVQTSCLFQSNWNATVQMCGGGWDAQYLQQGTLGPYEGNSFDAYFGQELSDLGFVGGYTGGISYFSTRSVLFAPAHWSPTTLPDGGTYEQAVTGYLPLYPSAISAGQYNLRAYTYGYIQDQTYSVYAEAGQVADMRLDLIIGVNVTLNILFKKESIITRTPYNMSARVRLFDDSGSLVAEWMSSEGAYTTGTYTSGTAIFPGGTGYASAADGTDQYPFGPLHPAVPVPKPLNTYNYVPAGITMLHVMMAGLPQVPAAGTDAGVFSQFTPQQEYMNDPLFATTICGFQINCYTSPGVGLGVGVPGYFPNTGIAGASDYTGGWTAEVDFVPWYFNNTSTPELASGGGQLATNPSLSGLSGITCGITTLPACTYAQYYPPVDGLLMGESYHIIPGTTAVSGISLTEDTALKPELVSHTLVANHLGPYSQQGVWQISGTHNSGEASGIFEVDLNGFISGNVFAFTWANEFRTVSWGTVSVTGATGATFPSMYTYDGIYQGYLPPGQYKFSIAYPGYSPQTWSVTITPGETGTGQNLYLEQNQIPVPEFSTAAIVAFSALAASVYILRRKRR